MVDISEVVEEKEIPASEERRLDAEAIEAAAQSMERVSARLHLEALAKKLRKESEALRRMEQSQAAAAATDSTSDTKENEKAASAESENVPQGPSTPAQKTPPTPAPTPSSANNKAAAPAVAPTTGKFTPIDRFSFDFGGYNSAFVTIYIPLPSVGSLSKENVVCHFTKDSFDLVVHDLEGKSYRLFKDHLDKDIEPDRSKYIIKADKVVIKLAKKKGEYGSYDYWSKLTDPKKGKSKEKENPQASIMQLMKDMYDEGDDNMKKVIGETFMKQQRGELGKDGLGTGLGDLKMDDDDF